ncbi:MAG: hypothetical protein AB1566_09690 [Chloroflexota bacterium]
MNASFPTPKIYGWCIAINIGQKFRRTAIPQTPHIEKHFTGTAPVRSGVQTLLIGGLAATAAFTLAKLIS